MQNVRNFRQRNNRSDNSGASISRCSRPSPGDGVAFSDTARNGGVCGKVSVYADSASAKAAATQKQSASAAPSTRAAAESAGQIIGLSERSHQVNSQPA